LIFPTLPTRELAWRYWALIIPLANMAVWLFLTGSKVVQVTATPVPYPVFVFIGTLLWSILIDALNAPLQQVNANRGCWPRSTSPAWH
jgi:lipopolysaccharide transport system permease protein